MIKGFSLDGGADDNSFQAVIGITIKAHTYRTFLSSFLHDRAFWPPVLILPQSYGYPCIA